MLNQNGVLELVGTVEKEIFQQEASGNADATENLG
jgi:hypothetical protein